MLIFTLIFLLLSISQNSPRDYSILYTRFTNLMILFTIIIAYNSIHLNFLEKGLSLFNGLYHDTINTHLFNIFILLLSFIILNLTCFYPRKIWLSDNYLKLLTPSINYTNADFISKMSEAFKIIEYSLIIIFIVIGALFLMSSSDLVSIFLTIELQSYGLYLLSSLYRNSELATSGGLTYFLLGGLSSCFILLATSLLYANSGTTSLDNVSLISTISNINNENLVTLNMYSVYYIDFCFIIMTVGFLFKISASPFHFWSPDVYDAIPTIVTTFVAIIAKISIFIFFLELLDYTSKSTLNINSYLKLSLLISCLLSLIIGSVLGLSQFRIKRLYAYSTISHLGFILLSLSIYSIESIQGFIFYIIQYSITNLNSFVILITIGFSLYLYTNNEEQEINKIKPEKNNSPIQLISQIKGYFYVNPFLAVSLCISLFSFAGIPPLIGFFAKILVFSAALDNGYVFLVLISIITSVISAVYYLGVIKKIFFIRSNFKLNKSLENIIFLQYEVNYLVKNNFINYKLYNIKISSSLSFIISNLTLIISLYINVYLNFTDFIQIYAISGF